jgi:hypothetical protein
LLDKCNRLIVVEGPDGAGKSILTQMLSEHFKWPVVHGGGPLTSRNEFLERNKAKGWNDPSPKILDRVSYISERVYATDPLVSSLELYMWIQRMKPVVIFCCLDTSEEMVEQISSSPKAHKSLQQLQLVKDTHPGIVAKYKIVMTPLIRIDYNWKRDDFRNLVSQIQHRIDNVWFS